MPSKSYNAKKSSTSTELEEDREHFSFSLDRKYAINDFSSPLKDIPQNYEELYAQEISFGVRVEEGSAISEDVIDIEFGKNVSFQML